MPPIREIPLTAGLRDSTQRGRNVDFEGRPITGPFGPISLTSAQSPWFPVEVGGGEGVNPIPPYIPQGLIQHGIGAEQTGYYPMEVNMPTPTPTPDPAGGFTFSLKDKEGNPGFTTLTLYSPSGNPDVNVSYVMPKSPQVLETLAALRGRTQKLEQNVRDIPASFLSFNQEKPEYRTLIDLPLTKEMVEETIRVLEVNIEGRNLHKAEQIHAVFSSFGSPSGDNVGRLLDAIGDLFATLERNTLSQKAVILLRSLLAGQVDAIYGTENKVTLGILVTDYMERGRSTGTRSSLLGQYQLIKAKGTNSIPANLREYHENLRDMYRNVRGQDPTAYAYKLSLYKDTKVAADKSQTLLSSYPELKRELFLLRDRVSRERFRAYHILGEIEDISSCRVSWLAFNAIKNRLMFLGYSELQATKFLTKRLYSITRQMGIVKCAFTGQLIPSIYGVPYEEGFVNIFYVYQHSPMFQQKSDPYRYVARKIAPSTLWDIEVKGYNTNALEYLSIKTSDCERQKMLGKENTFEYTPFLGIELEVERSPAEALPKADQPPQANNLLCPEHMSSIVYDLLGRDYIILKRDGTLRGYRPMEIVTIPATLNYHRERWANFLASPEKKHLQSYQSGNCGMHIHVSRNSLTGLHLAKFMRFINSKENHNFITQVAQRAHNDYARYYTGRTMKDHINEFKSSDKYCAVNTKNANTIEVRIFRGNLATVSFMKNLEFVHAVWRYTKDIGMTELKYTAFLRWLFAPKNDRKEYQHLKLWLVSSGHNISNVLIKNTMTDLEKARRKELKETIKKTQQGMQRRYKMVDGKICFKNRVPTSTEELLQLA